AGQGQPALIGARPGFKQVRVDAALQTLAEFLLLFGGQASQLVETTRLVLRQAIPLAHDGDMRGAVVAQTGHFHRCHGRDGISGDYVGPGPRLRLTRFPYLESHDRIRGGIGDLFGRELTTEVRLLHRLLVDRRRLALDAAPGSGEVSLERITIEPEAGRQG